MHGELFGRTIVESFSLNPVLDKSALLEMWDKKMKREMVASSFPLHIDRFQPPS
jgi:hypothetical protein